MLPSHFLVTVAPFKIVNMIVFMVFASSFEASFQIDRNVWLISTRGLCINNSLQIYSNYTVLLLLYYKYFVILASHVGMEGDKMVPGLPVSRDLGGV